MSVPGQATPPAVPTGAKQGGDTRARWAWVEAGVWTERMLAALEKGVKGGVWFSLIDKVREPRTLERAWEQVRSNGGSPGVDGMTIEHFAKDSRERLLAVNEQIQSATYQPKPVKRVWIDKPGGHEKRPLGVPTVTDRIVQSALRMVIEAIFEKDFAEHSYGFRPGKGCKDALRRVDELLQAGKTWVVDADLKSYFDTIPHERLLEKIRGKIGDGGVLALVESYLRQRVLEDSQLAAAGEEGTPQGAVISPLLANIYLDGLDWLAVGSGYEMIRYADDFVVLCASREEAQEALRVIQQWVNEAGLTLHPEKTRIVDAAQPGGFDFLGYHFEQGRKTPRAKSLRKFKDTIRERTPRNAGQSLRRIIAGLKPTMRGWFEYFQHSWGRVFPSLDGWIRQRMRSILRRRARLNGCGRGADHQRWPNSYFAELGYFSLEVAWKSAKSLRL